MTLLQTVQDHSLSSNNLCSAIQHRYNNLCCYLLTYLRTCYYLVAVNVIQTSIEQLNKIQYIIKHLKHADH